MKKILFLGSLSILCLFFVSNFAKAGTCTTLTNGNGNVCSLQCPAGSRQLAKGTPYCDNNNEWCCSSPSSNKCPGTCLEEASSCKEADIVPGEFSNCNGTCCFNKTSENTGEKCMAASGICDSKACTGKNVTPNDCPSDVPHCCGSAENGSGCTKDSDCSSSQKCDTSSKKCIDKNDGGGSAGGGSNTTSTFANPLQFTKIEQVVNAVLNNLRADIIVLAIVFIVVGAIMYMVSAGNEKLIDQAKLTITCAVIGLSIALAAPTFLKEIMDILGSNPTTAASFQSALTIKQIAYGVLNLLLSVIGVIGIIGLIVGGIFYLTAYGDEDRINLGKTTMTYAIIGIVLALGALVIVKQISAIILGQ